jgi:hypothetical protein
VRHNPPDDNGTVKRGRHYKELCTGAKRTRRMHDFSSWISNDCRRYCTLTRNQFRRLCFDIGWFLHLE